MVCALDESAARLFMFSKADFTIQRQKTINMMRLLAEMSFAVASSLPHAAADSHL